MGNVHVADQSGLLSLIRPAGLCESSHTLLLDSGVGLSLLLWYKFSYV